MSFYSTASPLALRIMGAIDFGLHRCDDLDYNTREKTLIRLAQKLDFIICFKYGRPSPPVTLETAAVTLLVVPAYTGVPEGVTSRLTFLYEGNCVITRYLYRGQSSTPWDLLQRFTEEVDKAMDQILAGGSHKE